ncbi:extracellular solute-binding protein [Paenibacillus sp. GYB004]|uniref:ABC transporter substrate-binding protein n=1 Tax=Paenibacillus sp. GYB004 TaxID=2994393 RepID=UPI002F96BC35
MPKHAKASAFLTSVLVTTLLAGCGGTGNGQNGASGTEKNEKMDTANNEPAEVIFYSHSGLAPEQFNNRYGNKLREKFPNYTIQYIHRSGTGTGIAEMVTAKTPFDIYFANVGSFENEAIQYGLQSDMTELLKKHQVDLGRFDPSIIGGVQSSPHGLYALPIHTDTMALYYNKDLFDKFGVEYPKNGMTWDEVYTLSKRLTRKDGDTQYIGYAPFSTYMFYMNPYSIPVVDGKTEQPTINKDSRWRSFYQKLLIEPTEMQEVKAYLNSLKTNKSHVVNAFMKDRSQAMLAYVSALAPTWPNEMKAFNWDWVSVPTLKEQPSVGVQPYTAYFGITNISQNKEAAMEVLKYMVSDEFQLSLAKQGYMPVVQNKDVKQALGLETAFKDKNWQALFYNKMAPVPVKGIYENRIVGVYNGLAEQAMLGTVDLNTALRQSEETAMIRLDEWKR